MYKTLVKTKIHITTKLLIVIAILSVGYVFYVAGFASLKIKSQNNIIYSSKKIDVTKKINPIQAINVPENFAVLLSGYPIFSSELENIYNSLIENGYEDKNIYLLAFPNENDNFNRKIDYRGTKNNLILVMDELANKIDNEDNLFFAVITHVGGYTLPDIRERPESSPLLGELFNPVCVMGFDYDDERKNELCKDQTERDVVERDFKFRYLVNTDSGGLNPYRIFDRYGLEQWMAKTRDNNFYRWKLVSHFDQLKSYDGEFISDDDIFIEEIRNYLKGDLNKNRIIEPELGEKLDFDGDGIMPVYFDPHNAPEINGRTTYYLFDEDDWDDSYELYHLNIMGSEGYLEEHYFVDMLIPNHAGSLVTLKDEVIFDKDLDNHMDIDTNVECKPWLGCRDESQFDVNGTDFDNDGLFDGVDVNSDGDMNDWLGINESIALNYGMRDDEVLDDELKIMFDKIKAKKMIIVLDSCYSGGFINDLSAPNRIIITSTEENDISLVTFFDSFWLIFTPEKNRTIVQAFENIYEHSLIGGLVPQYDDNGDRVSHYGDLPLGGDGYLGNNLLIDFNYLPQRYEENINTDVDFSNFIKTKKFIRKSDLLKRPSDSEDNRFIEDPEKVQDYLNQLKQK